MSTSDDFLHGADEIADFLGVSTRRAYYLLETRTIPAARLGSKWTARKSRLLQHLESLENAALAEGREVARG